MDDPDGRLRVADFPRPPAIEPERRMIVIVLGGVTIAETRAAWRILETTHPPTYYLPPDAFVPGSVLIGQRRSHCEWKGTATYVTLHGGRKTEVDAGWFYPDPTPPYAALRGHIAVYAGRMDACYVGEERVTPQPGGFYGGWITPELIGPFKGAPGTEWW
jgi:uncharacterized protein (DUF427 family)